METWAWLVLQLVVAVGVGIFFFGVGFRAGSTTERELIAQLTLADFERRKQQTLKRARDADAE